MENDEVILRKLGYRQVLQRTWGRFTAASMAVSALSVLTSISVSLSTGLSFGGPVICVWGWIGISLCMLCIGLGMAELMSAYPTSSGGYFCQYRLASSRMAPLACWVSGWLSLLGQIADVSAVAFLCSKLISTMTTMASTAGGGQFTLTPGQELGVYGGCLFLSALLNRCGACVLRLCTQFGGILHVVGVMLLALGVPLMATQHQPASWVFGHFETAQAAAAGIVNPFLAWPCSTMQDMYRPVTVILNDSIWAVTFVGGLGLIISLLFSITSIPSVLDAASASGGNVVAHIIYDASVQRIGTPQVGIGLCFIILLGVFFCCVATVTVVSRLLFCYSRDKAVPFSAVWVQIDPWTHSPTPAVWGVTVAAFFLGLPMLGSVTAFNAIISLSTVALNVVYVMPITARCTWGRCYFEPGPFHLGAWAYPLGAVSTLWMLFSTVVFCLPTQLPASAQNLNYAGFAFLGTTAASLLVFYFPKYGAYKWFKGPMHGVEGNSAHMMDYITSKDVDVFV